MAFLLDTSAISEFSKPHPNAGFTSWVASRDLEDVFISSISVGEIQIGVEMLDHGERRKTLEQWFQSMLENFRARILPFDDSCARVWASAVAQARRAHKPLPLIDAQIAAVAIAHQLAVVTRNDRHFTVPGYEDLLVMNPWT